MARSRIDDVQIRKEQLLSIAINLAKKVNYDRITCTAIAAEAGVSHCLVLKHFNTMSQLKRKVMRAAIARKVVEIVAQGLGAKDPQALKAPDDLKKKALDFLAQA